MISAYSHYNKKTIKKLAYKTSLTKLIMSIIMCLVMVLMGITLLVSSFSGKIQIATLIASIVVIILSPSYILLQISTINKKIKYMCAEMNLDKGDQHLEYKFKDNKMEVELTQGESVVNGSILLKNLYYVKITKSYISIFVNEKESYLILKDEYRIGSHKELSTFLKGFNIRVG